MELSLTLVNAALILSLKLQDDTKQGIQCNFTCYEVIAEQL
jgi:hypothetical protein